MVLQTPEAAVTRKLLLFGWLAVAVAYAAPAAKVAKPTPKSER